MPGSDFDIEVDLVVLVMGFAGVETDGLAEGLGLATDPHGNLLMVQDHTTLAKAVFAAGDCRSGPSLVVRAIADGRRTAESVEACLSHL